jgi:hypothetical protein
VSSQFCSSVSGGSACVEALGKKVTESYFSALVLFKSDVSPVFRMIVTRCRNNRMDGIHLFSTVELSMNHD